MTARFCCAELKESAGAGHCTIIGVRKAESSRRAKRKELEKVHKDKSKRKSLELNEMEEQDFQCVGGERQDNTGSYTSLVGRAGVGFS